jgi:hypothetical protein
MGVAEKLDWKGLNIISSVGTQSVPTTYVGGSASKFKMHRAYILGSF